MVVALEAVGTGTGTDADDEPLALPEGHALVDALLDLAVPHREVPLVLGARPRPGTDAWWLVERTARALASRLGTLEHDPAPPDLPDAHPFARWANLLALTAVAPRTRRWWAGRGVPDDVVRATLADVGRHVTHARRRTGHGGLVNATWLALHARGQIVQLGRLQLERCRLSAEDAASITAQGTPVRAGDHALGVHIPDYCGPFTPRGVRGLAAPGRGVLRPLLPGRAGRGGHLPLLAARPAARPAPAPGDRTSPRSATCSTTSSAP